MKYSEQWLKEWIHFSMSTKELASQLTNVGLEVESLDFISKAFKNVVLGKILSLEKHPEAEKLTICQVDIGDDSPLQIVCGASNVRVNQLVAVAMIGAQLPGDIHITEVLMRGVRSCGMLCSAEELAIPFDASQEKMILELFTQETLGTPIENILGLDDVVMDIGLTPNRGDCLSIRGLAREIGAITNQSILEKNNPTLPVLSNLAFCIELSAPKACPLYRACVIRNIPKHIQTPTWMRERLTRSGVRCIHFLVDVTNYVMLEYGQPMHAFDYAKWQGENIFVRYAKSGEVIQLLDHSELILSPSDLVIADANGAQALAGVMGGLHSAVQSDTTDIILESAYFTASQVAAQRARYALQSESSYRFERGVDPELSELALARAVDLIISIAGGTVQGMLFSKSDDDFPKPKMIILSLAALNQLSGAVFSEAEVESVLKRLRFICQKNASLSTQAQDSIFEVTVPSDRWDVSLPEDLMEEVIRLLGFDRIPTEHLHDEIILAKHSELDSPDFSELSNLLAHLGYQEIISYSFVDPDLQEKMNSIYPVKSLTNPISKELSQMRTQLWSGLLKTATHHFHYGQFNLRLFEIGICFREKETLCLGGLVSGQCLPEQWGAEKKASDFFSAKGDLQNILTRLKLSGHVQFKPQKHLALHDGKSAALMVGDAHIGWIGEIHPRLAHELEITEPLTLFEMNLDLVLILQKTILKPSIQLAPKLPSVRRDLALLVPDQLPSSLVLETILESGASYLENVFLFDRYQGAGVQSGHVSLALGLIFRHSTRTLTEEEIQVSVDSIIQALALRQVVLRSA